MGAIAILILTILLGVFAYGATRMNMDKDRGGFPETRKRRSKN